MTEAKICGQLEGGLTYHIFGPNLPGHFSRNLAKLTPIVGGGLLMTEAKICGRLERGGGSNVGH